MITVHGLYRSGTNYTRTLLTTNTSTKVLPSHEYAPHSKHRRWCGNSRKILVYKDFDVWMESIERRCYDLEVYEDVLWEPGHAKLESWAGVPNEKFSGKHKVLLSVEKLTKLYQDFHEFWEDTLHYNYVDILKDPEGFLRSLNIPLNDELILAFDQVKSSEPVTQSELVDRYLHGTI